MVGKYHAGVRASLLICASLLATWTVANAGTTSSTGASRLVVIQGVVIEGGAQGAILIHIPGKRTTPAGTIAPLRPSDAGNVRLVITESEMQAYDGRGLARPFTVGEKIIAVGHLLDAARTPGETVLMAEVIEPVFQELDRNLPALRGVISGTYQLRKSVPDAGRGYDLTGAGMLEPARASTIFGTISSTGFIRNGRAGGTLTLTGPEGPLTVRLLGQEQPGFAPLPHYFHYTIAATRGARREPPRTGSVELLLTPADAPQNEGGRFTMTFGQ